MAVSTTVERPMPKPKPDRNDVAVKMDAEVVRKAKIVAAFRGLTLAEYLSVSLGSFVSQELDSEYAKEVKGSKSR